MIIKNVIVIVDWNTYNIFVIIGTYNLFIVLNFLFTGKS